MVLIPFPVNTLYKLLFLTCQALSSSPSLLQDVGSNEFDLKMTKRKFAAKKSAISDLPWHHWLTIEDAKKIPCTLTHSHDIGTHFLLRENQVPLEIDSIDPKRWSLQFYFLLSH